MVVAAITDATVELYAYYDDHGTGEGGEEQRNAVYSVSILGISSIYVLPVFGSSHPMSFTVKCKAFGAVLLWAFTSTIIAAVYQNVVMAEFFKTVDIVTKVLLRTLGMGMVLFMV